MTTTAAPQSLTGGEAIVRSLIAEGVSVLFGLPGIQNDWLFNALYDARDRIRVVHTRHEQGAAYMALGYALATGEVGVYSVVPGPGVLNATAALANAYGLGAPVLCLAGQIPSAAIGRGTGVLHELPDQLAILRQLTKWAQRIESPASAPDLVAEAFYQLRSGRPRPAALEVPMDVLADRTTVPSVPPKRSPFAPPVDADAIEAAALLLHQAKRPMIFVGSGAQGAASAVRAVAEYLQAPVVAYRTGRGVVDSRHELSFVMAEAHPSWREVDVALAVGTNLRTPLQTWGIDSALTRIQIDVDPTAPSRIRRPELAITARAEDALPSLLAALRAAGPATLPRTLELQRAHDQYREQTAYLHPQLAYLDVIRRALGEDGIVVDEVTRMAFTARLVLPVYHPRTFISTGHQGNLGFGFQTALGVKVARPNVPVVSIAGDGGFMFGVQELATAVQHRIGVVVLVFNNASFGNVAQMQRERYGGREIASQLHNPDFVALAHSFGAHGYRVTGPAELEPVLMDAVGKELPTLIEIPVGDLPDIDKFRKLPRIRGQ